MGFFGDQQRFEFKTLEEENEQRIPRDRYERPLIWLPDGSKKVPYARASGYGGKLENKYNLELWDKRQVLRGVAIDPTIITKVPDEAKKREVQSDMTRPSKDTLNALVEQAKEAAGSNDASALGTAIHAATEYVDRGESLDGLSDLLKNRANAYYLATREAGLKMDSIETFGVEDENEVAGTWDRTGSAPWFFGKRRILDVKGLAVGTLLATPTGWTTMGGVEVGDEVLGPDGKPTRVTVKSERKRIGTYVVRFDDGAEVICDSEHIWWTERSKRGDGVPEARSIQEVIATLRSPHGQAWHRVPVAEPLALPEADLPLHPYLLGAWLGDGTASKGCITKSQEMLDLIERETGLAPDSRWEDKRRPHVVTGSYHGLTSLLRSMGVLNAKHIPGAYLRGSISQRIALLQGLLDTDGGWNTARGREVFTTMDEGLARQVEELCLSLGQKPTVTHVKRHGFGKDVMAWTVEFLPVDLIPHLLGAKRDSWLSGKQGRPVKDTMARRRVIVSVEPGPDVETACIAVDNDSHVYLAGRRMVPTHNTSGSMDFAGIGFMVQLAEYAHMFAYDLDGTRTPHENMDLEVGIIIHVGREMDGPVEFHRVDIAAGWQFAALSRQVIVAQRRGSTKGAILEIAPEQMAIWAASSDAELRELWGTIGDPRWKAEFIARAAELEAA